MPNQNLLTLLFEIVTVTFALVVARDFAIGLSQLGWVSYYPQKTDVFPTNKSLTLPLFESESKPAVESLPQSESEPETVLPVLLELAT